MDTVSNVQKAHGQLHQKETKKSANEALVIDLCIKDMESSHSGFIDRLQGPKRGTTMYEGMPLKTQKTKKQRKQKLEKERHA